LPIGRQASTAEARSEQLSQTETFAPGPRKGTVRANDGAIKQIPEGWALLLPGDATLTRRVKAAGPSWVVQEKKGRRTFSQGVWAPAATIEQLSAALVAERSTETHARKVEAGVRRRAMVQANYVEDFLGAVVDFLGFHPSHRAWSHKLAKLVADHATPVGSGTVARTQLIPIEQRAEAAVIAWMRHQTTAYDRMVIARIKGKRREVRRMLAGRSRDGLATYRRGEAVPPECPLARVLARDELPST